MASTSVPVQKHRAKMFSLREIEVLTEFMKLHLSFLRASHAQGGPGAAQRATKLWERVTEEINACGQCPRTVKQVKEKWRNMVKMAKSDVTADRSSMRKTGGGPARPEMSHTSQTVAGLFESSASFHGVCSDADTVINFSSCGDVDLGQQVVDNLLNWDQQEDTDVQHGTSDTSQQSDLLFATVATLGNSNQPPVSGAVKVRQADTVPEGTSTQPDCPEGSATDVGVPCVNSSALTTRKQSSTGSQQKKSSTHKRTLKDLQMEYYEKQIGLSDAQLECYTKIAKLADVLIEKFK